MHGFIPNLFKKSWTVSNTHVKNKLLKYVYSLDRKKYVTHCSVKSCISKRKIGSFRSTWIFVTDYEYFLYASKEVFWPKEN